MIVSCEVGESLKLSMKGSVSEVLSRTKCQSMRTLNHSAVSAQTFLQHISSK